MGVISPCVVPESLLGARARARRRWRWARVGAGGGDPWSCRSAICDGMNCGVPMSSGGGRAVSGSCGSGTGRAVPCWMNCDVAVAGGGGPVAGGVCRAFCSCRCQGEGWQQSGSFSVRTVFLCSLGYKQSHRDQTPHREWHGRAGVLLAALGPLSTQSPLPPLEEEMKVLLPLTKIIPP